MNCEFAKPMALDRRSFLRCALASGAALGTGTLRRRPPQQFRLRPARRRK